MPRTPGWARPWPSTPPPQHPLSLIFILLTPEDHRQDLRDRFGLVAFAIYAVLSIVFFGRTVVGDITGFHLGRGPDPSFLMWALVWWPYAIAHRLNPFFCRLVWAPGGFNLTWSGSIPLASLAAAPLTSRYGPVAAYNTLCLVVPVVAAWCSFALCRDVSKRYWPAVAGGYIFGFSSYVLGQMVGGHLNLIFIFAAPLIVKLVLRRLTGRLRATSFAILLALVFAVQFLLSIELAATVVMFGGLALIAAWSYAAVGERKRITDLIGPIASAGILAMCILSPYLYYLLAQGMPSGAINSAGQYSADLINLIIPTRTLGIGNMPIFMALSGLFPGNLGEAGAYLGIPLVAIVFSYAYTHWREPAVRTLVTMLIVISILALGPRIHVAGTTAFGMPWKLFTHLPLIKSALPVRFMAYASLVAGMTAALWLADETINRWLRISAAAALVVFSLPNLDARFFGAPANIPQFISNGAYRQYLHPNETVVAIPYGISGGTMLWQGESKMYFAMAGGYTGITPREFSSWPIVGALSTQTVIPDEKAQLMAFMARHGVSAIIVNDEHLAFWGPLLEEVDPSPVHAGDISIYRPSQDDLARYRDASAIAMERRNDAARIDALIVATSRYLESGKDPAQLTPMNIQKLGLLPANWVSDPDVRTNNGLYLGPWKEGGIAIGVVGSYDALASTIEKYRQSASQVFFPYPKELKVPPTGDTFMRLLVMVFDRQHLATIAGGIKAADHSERDMNRPE
jgi:hypothetical protein